MIYTHTHTHTHRHTHTHTHGRAHTHTHTHTHTRTRTRTRTHTSDGFELGLYGGGYDTTLILDACLPTTGATYIDCPGARAPSRSMRCLASPATPHTTHHTFSKTVSCSNHLLFLLLTHTTTHSTGISVCGGVSSGVHLVCNNKIQRSNQKKQ